VNNLTTMSSQSFVGSGPPPPLENNEAGSMHINTAVVFMCPPVGWQHVNMGRALFECSGPFRDAMNECAAVCDPLLPKPLIKVLFPDACDETLHEGLLLKPTFAMPATFAVEYALHTLFVLEGCTPFAVIGHSLGEFVAATIAGVLDVRTALCLVCERARVMDATSPVGSMMALKLSADDAVVAIQEAEIAHRVSVAAINGPLSCVLSGEDAALSSVVEVLPKDTKATRVRTSRADHCSHMAPVAAALEAKASDLYALVPPAAPGCLWCSAVADHPATVPAAIAPSYWSQHALRAVDFPRALKTVLASYAKTQTTPVGDQSRRLCIVELGNGMLERFASEIIAASPEDRSSFEIILSSVLPRSSMVDRASWSACAAEVSMRVQGVTNSSRHEKLERFLRGA
jgi:acyl transferase domain-containing protein